MNFILLASVALIPLVLGITIVANHKNDISKKLMLLMFLISIWQLDIAILFANQLFSAEFIEAVFRMLRFGPLFLAPLLYSFNLMLFQRLRSEKRKWLSILYNKYALAAFIGYSLFLYMIGWTAKGVQHLKLESGALATHMYPVYGEWETLYLIDLLLIVFNVASLIYLSLKVKEHNLYPLSIWLSLSFLLLCIIGIISLTDQVPLFVSSLNSILITVLISIIYFQMHTKIIRKMNMKLEEQQHFLKTVIDLNPSLINVKNEHGKIVLANKTYLDFYDTTMEQIYGYTEESLNIPADELDKHLQQDRYIFQTKKGIILEEETMTSANKESKTVEITKIPIHRENSLHILCVANDITQRKENERMLIKSEKLNIVGELAAGVAHEIRNPLTTLKGFTQIMKYSDADKYKEYLDLMSDEIERINSVAGELLTISKPIDVPYTEINISNITNDVKKLLDTNAILNNIQINIYRNDDNLFCIGNANQLKQVLINIIKNSIEAEPKDNQVEIFLGHKNDSISVKVVDRGKGISSERIKTIGEPFYTTKEKGTGLGLMVCFKIIKNHKGTIEFQSELGEGTVVEILLPAAQTNLSVS